MSDEQNESSIPPTVGDSNRVTLRGVFKHVGALGRPFVVALRAQASTRPGAVVSRHRTARSAYDAAQTARADLADGQVIDIMEWMPVGQKLREVLPRLRAEDRTDDGRKEIIRDAGGRTIAVVELEAKISGIFWSLMIYRGDRRFTVPDRATDCLHRSYAEAVSTARELHQREPKLLGEASIPGEWWDLHDPHDPRAAVQHGDQITVNVTKAFEQIAEYLERIAMENDQAASIGEVTINDVVPTATWAGLVKADYVPEAVDHMVITIRGVIDRYYPNDMLRGTINLTGEGQTPYAVLETPDRIPRHLDIAAVIVSDGLNGIDPAARDRTAAIDRDELFDVAIGVWHYYMAILLVLNRRR